MMLALSADSLIALLVLLSFGAMPAGTSGLDDSRIKKQLLQVAQVTGLLITLAAWVFPIREALVALIPFLALLFGYVAFKKRAWTVWLAMLAINVLISSSLWLRPISWNLSLAIKLFTLFVATLVWIAAVKNHTVD
jgi:uncharacterized membrane protein